MNVIRTLLISAAAAVMCSSVASAGTYTVRAGDTLFRIAQAHGMNTQQLMGANGLSGTTIEIGQKLTVWGDAKAAVSSAPNSSYSGGVNITAAASRYLNIPYRLGGNGNGSIDCSSYTQLVFRQMGISIPRIAAQQWRTGSAVSSRNLRAGDLVFFNTSGRGVSHVGIYMGNGTMANANSYYGRSMVEPMFSNSYWANRYVGARRVL